MSADLKNVFDKKDPEKKLENLNALNQAYMLEYLQYQVDNGNKEKVAAYAAATQGKSAKEKKRAFALDFMPYLLKDSTETFEEKLAKMLK